MKAKLKPLSKKDFVAHYEVYKSWKDDPNPTPEVVRRGQAAEDIIIRSNIGFCEKQANRLLRNTKYDETTFEDLVSEGMAGLKLGLDRFDVSSGYSFLTFAGFWVKNTTLNYMANVHHTGIRLPKFRHEDRSKLRKLTREMRFELGREPSEEELAERMEITVDKLYQIEEIFIQAKVHSLDAPAEHTSFHDFVEDHSLNAADSRKSCHAIKTELSNFIDKEFLHLLTDLELKVIVSRYGLLDGKSKGFRESGEQLGYSYEYIRQVEKRAMKKFKEAASSFDKNTILETLNTA